MTMEPNCPRCSSTKFIVVSRYELYKTVNQYTKEDCFKIADLLCCDSCGAVICQFDHTKSELKPI